MPASGTNPSLENDGSLEGVLERIIFFNEENFYTIAELREEKNNHKVVVAGPLPGVQCGETLSLQGQWIRHPTHGDQFKVRSFQSRLPATLYGIRKYLGSGLIAGIGEVYADKIVDQFGMDTFRIISEESALLRKVAGIGKQRARAIKEAWDQQSSLREVIVFLRTYGVSVSQCKRIVDKYGPQAPLILQQEPYRVAREIEGIGFKTADRIAINLGLANDSPARLEAGLIYCLQELEDEGHTAYPENDLLEKTAELLQTPLEALSRAADQMVRQRNLIRREETETVYLLLPVTDFHENRLVEALQRLASHDPGLPPIRVDAAIHWAEQRAGFSFHPRQADALRNALHFKISLLTGGPGTGKTTILRALVAILRAKNVRVHLAAPTGRAAQRLAESARYPAQTLHRLLRFDPAKGVFSHHENAPLKTDFVIVDEVSMLDLRLASCLIRALPAAACLLLVGDSDQLPSVGPGQILGDLLSYGKISSTRLDTVYRQSERSSIVTTAHSINRGDPRPPHVFLPEEDWATAPEIVLLAASDPEETSHAIENLLIRVLPGLGFDAIRDCQVLAPMHRGGAGVGRLNERLQNLLNPNGRSAPGGFRIGDKVMQLRNDYEREVFNGDTGIVESVQLESLTMEVRFDERLVSYERGTWANLTLAYAMSIHKSQGSEYPVVIIPLLKQHFLMLQRNLVYTAVTRGRNRVFLVGDPAAYAMAVRNAESRQRCTLLKTRLSAVVSQV